ncbi:hypothetical protein Lepto7375DRAFT_5244 [Leptolyngbya sp. PCC 7375]|nr:hypothetical protein Lepto7375DRAFT_5244 [Leptolyngbya sp. PCC 7375]
MQNDRVFNIRSFMYLVIYTDAIRVICHVLATFDTYLSAAILRLKSRFFETEYFMPSLKHSRTKRLSISLKSKILWTVKAQLVNT